MKLVLASVCLGAAVGMLVGLSTSPVVASVVGALAAILATWFGLGERGGRQGSPERLLGFTLGLLVAVPTAVYSRSAHLLEPGLLAEKVGLMDLGLRPDDAAAVVVASRYGGAYSVLDGRVVGTIEGSPGHLSVLFSGEGDRGPPDPCALMTRNPLAASEELERWSQLGGAWGALAAAVSSGDPATVEDRVAAARTIACPVTR